MPEIKIDPFEKARKNAHIWRGEKCLIWYNERLDDSFTVLVLYNFEEKKRRLFLDVDNSKEKIEFKNDVLPQDLYENLKKEVEAIERLLGKT